MASSCGSIEKKIPSFHACGNELLSDKKMESLRGAFYRFCGCYHRNGRASASFARFPL
jgi:hypothetical protein